MEKAILEKEFSFLRDKAKLIKKGIIDSLFAEVYKVGDFAMKIREFESLEELKEYSKYQQELQKSFDFLPIYYGSLLGEDNGKIVFVSFFEWIPHIESFTYSDVIEILRIMSQLYQKGYCGSDFKWSNFGKKEGKIYYLDDLGIGRIIPKDIEKWLKSLLKKGL